MKPAKTLHLLAILALMGPTAAWAATISLTPSATTVVEGSSAVFDLVMDFTGEPTLGGSIDIALTGPIAFAGFTPSAFYNGLNTDPGGETDFTGFDAVTADTPGGFQIHFGDFDGLSGVENLGQITVDALAVGVGNVDLAANSLWGPFVSSVTFVEQPVTYSGAEITVTAIPLPPALALYAGALLVLGRFRAKHAVASTI